MVFFLVEYVVTFRLFLSLKSGNIFLSTQQRFKDATKMCFHHQMLSSSVEPFFSWYFNHVPYMWSCFNFFSSSPFPRCTKNSPEKKKFKRGLPISSKYTDGKKRWNKARVAVTLHSGIWLPRNNRWSSGSYSYIGAFYSN